MKIRPYIGRRRWGYFEIGFGGWWLGGSLDLWLQLGWLYAGVEIYHD